MEDPNGIPVELLEKRTGLLMEALARALERLVGTRSKTDITTGQKQTRRGFGLIGLWHRGAAPEDPGDSAGPGKSGRR
jgi:hypothetical protein